MNDTNLPPSVRAAIAEKTAKGEVMTPEQIQAAQTQFETSKQNLKAPTPTAPEVSAAAVAGAQEAQVVKDDVLLKIAIDFSLLSLVAIGGANAIVPELHRQLVDVSHWLTDAEFANLFAIGQVAPGPNIMVLSLVGWRMAAK